MVLDNNNDQVHQLKKVFFKKPSSFSELPSALAVGQTRSRSVPLFDTSLGKTSRSTCHSTNTAVRRNSVFDGNVAEDGVIVETVAKNRSGSSFQGVSETLDEKTPFELLPISILDEETYFEVGEDVIENPRFSNKKERNLCLSWPAAKETVLLSKSGTTHLRSCNVRRAAIAQDSSTTFYGESRGSSKVTRKFGRESVYVSKTKLTQLLKTTQLEQLSKLQNKHQQECELLDDIRNFGKQRSELEKHYGQALQKLVSQYLKKDLTSTPDNEESEKKTVLAVWKSVLEATDKAAQARITVAENYKNNIYEAVKNCRSHKETQLKKSQDLLNTLQNEITETIKELTKAKKKYYDLEQVSLTAKEKFQDVTERLKKNRTSIFKNKAGLEKTVQKLEQRCDESNVASTIARNEYLLMLSAANTHQRRYYESDMPEAMRMLDGDLYKKLQEYLGSLCRYEIDTSATTREAFSVPAAHATKISREYNMRCFLRENPVFEWGPRYEYEACGTDDNKGTLVPEKDGDDNSLNREARKWAGLFVRDSRRLMKHQKMKNELENLALKYTENPELTTDVAAQETEARLEKCREDLRRAETNQLQEDARLQLLKEAGVDIDTWIESARAQAAKDAAKSTSHANHSHNVSIRNHSVHNASVDGETPLGADDCSFFEDEFCDDETFDEEADTFELDRDNLSLPSSEHSRVYPVSCTVRYAYQATREDELTIRVGDQIEAVEDGDLDQWVKARDSGGNIGYVPENYLEFPTVAVNTPTHHQYSLPPGEDYSNALESESSGSSTSGASSLTSSSKDSGNDREVGRINSGIHITQARVCLAKAIYEYEACSEEELSIPENAIVTVLSKNDNGVDDGWWKGELNGRIGVFPGIVVEEIVCTTDSKSTVKVPRSSPSVSPVTDVPPSFRPPPPMDCPPPPPMSGDTFVDRNPSPDSGVVQNELAVPAVRPNRSSSAPSSPIYAQVHRPNRVAPPPPTRPSFIHSRGAT